MRFFIFIFVVSAFISCDQNQSVVADKKQQTQQDTVKIFLLAMDSAQRNISLPGELLPNENVQIRAKVSGYIRKLNVDIGSKVKKGQVLAFVDAPEINTRIQELNEKVNAAHAKYLSSKDYFERINTAAKADGVIAPSEFQHVRNQMMADSSDYRAAFLAASSIRQTGDYLTIIAPYTGIITKRNIETGSFVGSIGDKPLFELEDNTILRLRVAIPEVYTSAILSSNSGELTTRSLPDKKIKAKLVRKSDIIDNETRSEIWEFEVPNANGELKAGSYADVKLRFLRAKQSFVVPVGAVVTTLEKKFVIKISNNVSQWIDVRAGFNMGDKLEIFGDLKEKDTLAIKGTEEFKPGTKVAIKF
jgi:membrane fusion protein (multidrug efflux system)